MSWYLWSSKTRESRLAGFTVTLRWPLLHRGCGASRLLWEVCVRIRNLVHSNVIETKKRKKNNVDRNKMIYNCFAESHTSSSTITESSRTAAKWPVWYLHGLHVLLRIVGLSGGDKGEGVLCDHSNLCGFKAIGVIVPLLGPLVLIAESRLRQIL